MINAMASISNIELICGEFYAVLGLTGVACDQGFSSHPKALKNEGTGNEIVLLCVTFTFVNSVQCAIGTRDTCWSAVQPNTCYKK